MAAWQDSTGGGREALRRSAILHREFVQLGALLAIAAAGFFATRTLAANAREMKVRDAAAWYGRGEQALGDERLADAVAAFRRAAAADRGDPRYVLALAHALRLNHEADAAWTVLLAVRDAAPENADLNLELARLAAERQDVPEALRFYRSALYAPWPIERSSDRRQVRLELIRFLLAEQQPGRALSELLASTTDLPATASARVEVARLFAAAGDHGHALQQFEAALKLARDDSAALAGAGHEAFVTGQYLLAQRYLRRAPPGLDEVMRTREVVDRLLSSDPLAARIGSLERRRRLAANLSYARDRLAGCLEQVAAEARSPADLALQQELAALSPSASAAGPLEQDTIEAGVDVVARVAARSAALCPPERPVDQAMLLIGRQHGDTR